MLSFNLVGHLGYTTVGFALMTPGAMAGSILYILHHIFVITNLYLVSGIFLKLRRTTLFAELGSVYRDSPAVALITSSGDRDRRDDGSDLGTHDVAERATVAPRR